MDNLIKLYVPAMPVTRVITWDGTPINLIDIATYLSTDFKITKKLENGDYVVFIKLFTSLLRRQPELSELVDDENFIQVNRGDSFILHSHERSAYMFIRNEDFNGYSLLSDVQNLLAS